MQEEDATSQTGTPAPPEHEPPTIFPIYHEQPDPTPDPKRWSSFLPIWGDAVRERGVDLPLPFGVSTNYLHARREVDEEDLRIGIDGGPMQSVSQFLQIDADSAVDVVIGRVDAWILPFLNVYGYGGWQWNESEIRLGVTIPTPPPLPDLSFVVNDDGKLDGPVYGAGVALAMGYEAPFLTAIAGCGEAGTARCSRCRCACGRERTTSTPG